jgi:hypothetical protein
MASSDSPEDGTADNLNPIGRMYYSASTFVCTTAARAQEGGWAQGRTERRAAEKGDRDWPDFSTVP